MHELLKTILRKQATVSRIKLSNNLPEKIHIRVPCEKFVLKFENSLGNTRGVYVSVFVLILILVMLQVFYMLL